jgi:hypothetical protein
LSNADTTEQGIGLVPQAHWAPSVIMSQFRNTFFVPLAGTTFSTPQSEKSGSVFEGPGLADRTFSNQSILSPVGRSA